MKTMQGVARFVRTPIVGIITRQEVPLLERSRYIYIGVSPGLGYAGILHEQAPPFTLNPTPRIHSVPRADLEALTGQHIVSLNTDGTVHVLWDHEDSSNCILMTEVCNCRCLMCPQPPKSDPGYRDALNRRILRLVSRDYEGPICLTGGEPTLNRKRFVSYLAQLSSDFSGVRLDVLTNGQSFSDAAFCEEIARVAPDNTTFCISLHSDVEDIHNAITGSGNGFRKTVNGIRNLGRLGLSVEVRFVVTSLNFSRLDAFAKFIGKNLPFVTHVAIMGMEITGDAVANLHKIWVDPCDCRELLRSSVQELHRRGVRVSLYNMPLCLVSREVWRFTRRSISSWKNAYLDKCLNCAVRSECCGVFATSQHYSANIQPVDTESFSELTLGCFRNSSPSIGERQDAH